MTEREHVYLKKEIIRQAWSEMREHRTQGTTSQAFA